MAENGTTNAEMNLGDLGQIRNILMGPQMSAFEERFKAMEAKMAAHSKDITERLSDLEKNSQKAMDTLEKGANSNYERLEKMVEKKLDLLSKKLDDTSSKDKARIGKLLSDMGKKLMDS